MGPGIRVLAKLKPMRRQLQDRTVPLAQGEGEPESPDTEIDPAILF